MPEPDNHLFERTVAGLLRMKPKPHDGAKDKEKDGDEKTRRRPASRSKESD